MDWLDFADKAPVETSPGIQAQGVAALPGPPRIVLDSTGTSRPDITHRGYVEAGFVPHFTLYPVARNVEQHLPLSRAVDYRGGAPIAPERIGQTVWVCIVKSNTELLDPEDEWWVGQVVGMIADALLVSPNEPNFYDPFDPAIHAAEKKMSCWRGFDDIATAPEVPMVDRFGPGSMDGIAFQRGLEGISLGEEPDLDPVYVEPKEYVELEELRSGDAPEQPEGLDVVGVEDGVPDAEEPEGEEDLDIMGKFGGREVSKGSGGKAVNRLRAALGMGEGRFDDELDVAVRDIQDASGLEVDGVVDEATWDAVREFVDG